jgi:membrane protein YdbS with pleckstrin-like domain
MKISITRLYLVEHPLVMILAVALITIGYSKAKKAISATSKYKAIVLFYSIGLCFILSRIPWSVWF